MFKVTIIFKDKSVENLIFLSRINPFEIGMKDNIFTIDDIDNNIYWIPKEEIRYIIVKTEIK